MKPLVVLLENPTNHDRLSVVLEQLGPGRWRTYVEHRRMPKGHRIRGATQLHYREKTAHASWKQLERLALEKGWMYRQVVVAAAPSGPVEVVGDRKFFRDARTGVLFADESSSRPLTQAQDERTTIDLMERLKASLKARKDGFNLDTLPVAAR